MPNVVVPKPSHRLPDELLNQATSVVKYDKHQLSLHDLAVLICVEAFADVSDQDKPTIHIPDRITGGNTLVLTLDGSPIWESRSATDFPRELFGSSPQDEAGGVFARHVTLQQSLYYLLATRLVWLGTRELSLYSVATSEQSHDDVSFDQFVLLAQALRDVAQSIADHGEKLQAYLNADQPCLIVSRDSGTVIKASPDFLRAWRKEVSPVGMLFTDIVQDLPPDSGEQWSTRMIHVGGELFPITVVTCAQTQTESVNRIPNLEIQTVTY